MYKSPFCKLGHICTELNISCNYTIATGGPCGPHWNHACSPQSTHETSLNALLGHTSLSLSFGKDSDNEVANKQLTAVVDVTV